MWSTKDWDWLQKNVPILCVDGVLVDEDGKILLSLRDVEPEKGKWHLPGGVVDRFERLEEAIKRVFKNETGLEVDVIRMIGVYDNPKRDPRGHFVTVAYLLKKKSGNIIKNYQASKLEYFLDLPDIMGFDSRQIIEDVRKN
jgi:8-oxo-dGTP diphosphatase